MKSTCLVRLGRTVGLGIAALAVAACGGGGGGSHQYTIGGAVAGLTGTLTLQNNGTDNLAVANSGPFTFATKLAKGSPYSVTILTQPAGQTCTVANGSGTATSDVTNVAVACVASTYSIGGTASGLNGTLVLQNNGSDPLTVAANGAFVFSSKVTHGSPYSVSILTQPAGQVCSVANGSGVATSNVTNVAVTCITASFSVGGTVTGLFGTVVLQNNGGDNLAINSNGPFAFPGKVISGTPYSVTVLSHPVGETCTVANGAGIATSDVTNISVVCLANPPTTYSIGGAASGLTGTVVLQNNGRDNLTVNANGPFTFAARVESGSAYSVTILAQPSGQVCSVSNGSGVATANVTSVAVSCITITYIIGGNVSGLSGTLVLQNNGTDSLTVTTNGAFRFQNQVPSGSPYSVTIRTQPAGQTCTVANGAGTATANVTDVAVTCVTVTYSIGGTASGLTSALVLLNNGSDKLTVPASGAFTFATKVPAGSAYSVTVQTPPLGQKCTITNGSGVAKANVTNVTIACSDTPPVLIGGSITGLYGVVALANNGGDFLATSSNGPFTFDTKMATGTTYSVTVATQPIGEYCTVTNGTGTVITEVTNIAVQCVPTYSIGGSISGLNGTVVLQNNGGDDLTLGRDGPFAFDTRIPSGSTYNVTVLDQPAGQLCKIEKGTGTALDNISNIVVTCTSAYTIGGTVTFQRLDEWVTLSNNGTDLLTIYARFGAGSAPFTFTTPIASGSTYDVKAASVPSGATCVVNNGTGKATANVTNVEVACGPATAKTATIAARIKGLNGTLLLQNGGQDRVEVGSDGTATFPTAVTAGEKYAVAVAAQPDGQTCLVTGGTGLAQGKVTSPLVTCVDNRTDSITGTYEVQGSAGSQYLTLFADGVYILAAVGDAATCGVDGRNGVEYGVYNYSESTSEFALVSRVVDTNGSCGFWSKGSTSRITGALQKSGSGAGSALTLTINGGGQFVLTAVPSVPGSIIGSFGSHSEQSFAMFSPTGKYVIADTQGSGANGTDAGVEYGCYTATGRSAGSMSVDLGAGCLAAADAALPRSKVNLGLARDLGSVAYSLTGPNAIQLGTSGGYVGVRIVPEP